MSVQALEKGMDAVEESAGLLETDAAGVPRLSREGISERVGEDDSESLGYWLKRLLREASLRGAGLSRNPAPLPVTKEILAEFRRQWERGPERMRVPVAAGIALKCGKMGFYCAAASGAPPLPGPAKKNCSPEPQRVILDGGFAEVSWRWGDRSYLLRRGPMRGRQAGISRMRRGKGDL